MKASNPLSNLSNFLVFILTHYVESPKSLIFSMSVLIVFLTFISSYVQALRVYACGYQKTTCGTSFSLLFGVLGAKLEASDMLAHVLAS